jgi:hypothetical protein
VGSHGCGVDQGARLRSPHERITRGLPRQLREHSELIMKELVPSNESKLGCSQVALSPRVSGLIFSVVTAEEPHDIMKGLRLQSRHPPEDHGGVKDDTTISTNHVR